MKAKSYIYHDIYTVQEVFPNGYVSYRILKGVKAYNKWMNKLRTNVIKGHIVSIETEKIEVCNSNPREADNTYIDTNRS